MALGKHCRGTTMSDSQLPSRTLYVRIALCAAAKIAAAARHVAHEQTDVQNRTLELLADAQQAAIERANHDVACIATVSVECMWVMWVTLS